MTGALTWANRTAKLVSWSPADSASSEQLADEVEQLGVEVGPALPGGGDGRRHVRPVGGA